MLNIISTGSAKSMRWLISLAVLLAPLAHGALSIYQDGKLLAECAAPAAQQAPPPPPVTGEYGALVYSRLSNGQGSAAQPLYEQIVLAPGDIMFEVLVTGVHHVDWYFGTKFLRRENAAPYTFSTVLAPGSYQLIANVYSSETTQVSRHVVLLYVADGGAVNGGGPQQPADALHRVLVSWQAPASRVDGTPLQQGELSFYDLMFAGMIKRYSADILQVTLELAQGSYEFRVAAVDSMGRTSDPSDPVRITL